MILFSLICLRLVGRAGERVVVPASTRLLRLSPLLARLLLCVWTGRYDSYVLYLSSCMCNCFFTLCCTQNNFLNKTAKEEYFGEKRKYCRKSLQKKGQKHSKKANLM